MLRVHSSHVNGFATGELKLTFFLQDEQIKVAKFGVPFDFKVSNDAVVATAIAIRPVNCTEIAFNFAVSDRASTLAARDYRIRIKGEAGAVAPMSSRHVSYLNFSGGLDSLAAHYLLGDVARNISINFGGHFQREADWFQQWPTYCIQTNFREKPFIETLDWRFMGACAMLYADYLQIETVYWGTILEAAPYWFSSNTKVDSDSEIPTHAFAIAGLKMAQAVTPLSEYGTMKVALQLGDAIVEKAIASCAAPKSEKLMRKLLLARLARGEEIDTAFWENNSCTRKHIFGTSFALDILTIYYIWKLGSDVVLRHLADCSEEQLSQISRLDMRFFEKYNPANLNSVPKFVRPQIIAGYDNAGIPRYSADDFIALDRCKYFVEQSQQQVRKEKTAS